MLIYFILRGQPIKQDKGGLTLASLMETSEISSPHKFNPIPPSHSGFLFLLISFRVWISKTQSIRPAGIRAQHIDICF